MHLELNKWERLSRYLTGYISVCLLKLSRFCVMQKDIDLEVILLQGIIT